MRAVSRLCLVVSASLLSAPFAVAQELTEAQVVMRFMGQNPEVRALRHRVEEQRQQNRTRTLVANPTFLYTQENAAGARDDFLLVRQPLPVTGRRGLFDTANREATASTAAEIEYEIHRLRTGVRSTFAALLRAQRREQALGDAVACGRGDGARPGGPGAGGRGVAFRPAAWREGVRGAESHVGGGVHCPGARTVAPRGSAGHRRFGRKRWPRRPDRIPTTRSRRSTGRLSRHWRPGPTCAPGHRVLPASTRNGKRAGVSVFQNRRWSAV